MPPSFRGFQLLSEINTRAILFKSGDYVFTLAGFEITLFGPPVSRLFLPDGPEITDNGTNGCFMTHRTNVVKLSTQDVCTSLDSLSVLFSMRNPPFQGKEFP